MNKVGPHVIRPTDSALVWARAAGIVKAIDDTTALRRTNAKVRVYRKYFPEQDINRPGGDVVDDVLQALGDAPATHIELVNERFQRLGQGLERYVEFTREAVARLRQRRPDLTLAAFSFSTGNPEPEDWAYLKAHGYGGAECIALHEYWGRQGFSTWNALRYRRVHEWTGGEHPPFLLTEVGRDRVEGGAGGWKADGLSDDEYQRELAAYDAELMKDPYVIGAVVFTAGPTDDWRAFDVDGIAGGLAAAAGPLPAPAPPPPPKEKPMLRGIDVSNYQAIVQWDKVAASGAAFAFVKASEDNDYFDPYFSRNWAGVKQAGLVRGAYHYARPENASPAASVSLFEKAIARAGGLGPGDLVALDIESGNGSLHVWVAEWLDLAERVFGVRPVLYTGRWFSSAHDLEHADLGKYPLWLASYQATVPPPLNGWDRLTFWQNDARGTVPGVVGDCDMDVFFGSREELQALGLPAPAEPAPAPPAPPVDAVDDALNGLWNDTFWHVNAGDEDRARALQQKIRVLKVALGREAA